MTSTTAPNGWSATTKVVAAAVLAVWAGAAYLAGTTGILTAPADEVFRPVVLSAVIPVAIFFTIYALSGRFRGFVLAHDIRSLTILQHWRVIGFGFLLLYAHNILPGLFAWPAGVGDVLVGLSVPLVMARLARDPAFATSRSFVTFHVMGLLDFAIAVATAMLASGAFPELVAGPITSAPMEVWPLNLFPSFGVPIFIILHAVVLLKVRALRQAAQTQAGAAWQTA